MKKTLLFTFLLLITHNINSQTLEASLIEIGNLFDGNPKNLTKGNDKIYFTANEQEHGTELWLYNGKTTQMVKDIFPGSSSSLEYTNFLVINDILYFTAVDGTRQTGLWKSDGTESGTQLIKYLSITNNYSYYTLLNFNGKLVFIIKDDNNQGESIWITDGTSAGTSLIKKITNSFNQAITNIKVFKNNLVFSAYNDTTGNELWISNGTNDGTKILKDIVSGSSSSNPRDFYILNDILFFTAYSAEFGTEIWTTDGTEAGTTILKDIYTGPYNSGIQQDNVSFIFNNSLYFFAKSNANSFELWKSDGRSSGTQMIKIISSNSSGNLKINGEILKSCFTFSYYNTITGREIWKSDGTSEGTTVIKTITPSPYPWIDISDFTLFKDKLYFSSVNSSGGQELWATDGSITGTQLIRRISSGTNGSSITKLTATSKFLFFSARDNLKDYNSLWISDGTPDGVLINKDINLSQFSNTELSFVELDNNVFFQGGYKSENGYELWKTDLSTTNSTLVKDINHGVSGLYDNSDFTKFEDKMIFAASNGINGTEPFITDGTIEGTKMIKDINAGDYPSIQNNYDYRPFFTVAGKNVFFRATSNTSGYELYKTDGTEANTTMVKDIAPGTKSSISEFSLFMANNNICYFAADDQVHGIELWRSDGTETGTYMLRDINSGSGNGITSSNIFYDHAYILNEKGYAVLNNALYFSGFDGGESSLWKTDGTSNGTVKAITIPSSGIYDTRPAIINETNNRIFFKTNTNNSSYGNNSLWSTDGTKEGTIFLGLWNITGPVQFKKNIVHNNKLYFTTHNEIGLALMVSDGTVAGTNILTKDRFTDLASFGALKSCGKYVYFTIVDNNGSGIELELWKTDGTKEGTILIEKIDNKNVVDYIHGCTCVQDNLFYLKRSGSKIWYVNDKTATPSYYDINITSGDNFKDFEGISHLVTYGNNLLFSGYTAQSGSELYSVNIDKSLGLKDFTDSHSNNDLNHITIFPNPSSSLNKLFISSDNNATIQNVEIYNILGTKIQGGHLNAETPTAFELKTLSKGIYLIKITTDNYVETKKLIIK